MAENFVRVYLAAGDEQQLTGIDPDDFVQFAGSINGQPIDVRFFNAEPRRGNHAFSIAAVEGKHTVLRVHLSLKAEAAKPGWTGGLSPRIYDAQHPVAGPPGSAAHGTGAAAWRHRAVPGSLTTGARLP